MALINEIIKRLPNRILSAIIDQISLGVGMMIFSIVDKLASTPEETKKIALNSAILLFSIFLNKDIYFGKSIGKSFTGLRVLSIRTGGIAGPIQCFIRNLFLLLWPVEALMLLFFSERRIGDLVAGTKVCEKTEINPEMKWPYVQAILSLMASTTLVYFLFTSIDGMGFMH